MKKVINFLLSVFSPLAAVPTGWAIYAGVTEIPAFPMWMPAAIVGAIAIITTSISAGVLVTDIYAYNQSLKNKTERETLTMPVFSAWAILSGCTIAEITLSLLIVVIPNALRFGVLVFPLMTAAGVFAFAVRFDLQRREVDRDELRAQSSARPRQPRTGAKKSDALTAVSVAPASKYPRKCDYCDEQIKNSNAVGGHMKKHHPELCKKPALADSLFGQVKP